MRLTLILSAFCILTMGCRERANAAGSSVASFTKAAFETNCPTVAKNVVIGIFRAERPNIQIDETCSNGGLCVNEGIVGATVSQGKTYSVTGEFASGAFAYDVVISESGDACLVKAVKQKYAD